MATEIYDDIDLHKKAMLDSRLESVATVALLPSLTATPSWIPEGAVVYVAGTIKANYQAQDDPNNTGNLIWVRITDNGTVQGVINILPSTTTVDLSLVSPAVATCNTILVNIVGGVAANITSITNWPVGEKLTFYSTSGQAVTYQHTDYDLAGANDIVIEDGANFVLSGRAIGDESLTLEQNNNTLVQWDATQFIKRSELLQNLLNIAIVDDLNSVLSSSALSANQGRVLRLLIEGKQDTLTAGDHIDITNNTITAEKWEWSIDDQTANALIVSIPNYLTTNYTTLTQRYRLTKFRNGEVWFLPVGLDPTTLANWHQLNNATPDNILVRRYPIFNEIPALDLNATTGNFYPKAIINAGSGDTITHGWGGPFGSANKYSLNLSREGLYKVKIKLVFDTGVVGNFTGTLHRTVGATQDADPVPTSSTIVDIATGEKVMVVETLQQVISSNAADNIGLILELSTITDFLGLNYNSNIAGWLEITKLR